MLQPVHPHMRGEDDPAAVGQTAWRRFTPTCVGKTTLTAGGLRPRPVHPHMRGEDLIGAPNPKQHPRFTPTCVGKTPSLPGTLGKITVHPPHAWGRRWTFLSLLAPSRFTPTCVGKTWTFLSLLAPSRFTPTCVGKTLDFFIVARSLTVHPHMRGEDRRSDPQILLQGGSPPHAWGRPQPAAAPMLGIRFTPTCVGKTRVHLPTGKKLSVHPHMRGEDLGASGIEGNRAGSPPHAWGRPVHFGF